MSKVSADILPAINALKNDEVVRIAPHLDKSIPGLKTAVERIAASNNFRVETWRDEAGDYFYVRKAQ